jgi:hypothetical protein
MLSSARRSLPENQRVLDQIEYGDWAHTCAALMLWIDRRAVRRH